MIAQAAAVRRDPAMAAVDARFMAMALALGRRGLGQTWPNPSVGAVVVSRRDDAPVVVGRGVTQPGGRPHAETEALRQAGAAARGATLYTTLEPCSHHGKTPPCVDAIVAAGIVRVVSAMEDPSPLVAGAGHARLRAAGIAVDIGEGAAEARAAHAGHILRMQEGRPRVTLKLAVSADGKTGLTGRRPAPITGEEARARVHLLRAMNDAVLTGIGTVLADDPLLTCRLPGMAARSPIRVVLDAGLRLPAESKLVESARDIPVWAIGGQGPDATPEVLQQHGVVVLPAVLAGGRIDLSSALQLLVTRGITRVMVEAGPRLAAAFLAADLVDEAWLLRGPDAVGADGLDALEGMPLSALTGSPRLVSRGVEAVGADTLEIFERAA